MLANRVQQVFYCGVLLIFLTPLLFWSSIWGPFHTPKVLGFMFLIVLLFPLSVYTFFNHQKQDRLALPKYFWIFLTFVLYLFTLTLSAFLGLDPINSFFGNVNRFGGVFLLFHLFLFLLYLQQLYLLKGEVFLRHVLIIVLASSFTVSIYGVLEFLEILPTMAESHLPRASSVFGNPTFFAAYLIIPFFLSLLGWKFVSKSRFYFLVPVVILLGVFVSGSRGAYLGIIVGTFVMSVVYWFKHRKHASREILKLTKVFFLLIALFVLLFSTVSDAHFLSRFKNTFDQRVVYWSMVIQEVGQHPILGIGSENFYIVANERIDQDFYVLAQSWPDKPHNYLLEILLAGGILAIVFYGGFLCVVIRRAWGRRHAHVYLGALTAYLTTLFFLFETVPTLVQFAAFLLFAAMSSESKYIFVPTVFRRPITLTFVSGIVVFVLCAFLYVPHAVNLLSAGRIRDISEQDVVRAADTLIHEDLDNRRLLDGTEWLTLYFDTILALGEKGELYDDVPALVASIHDVFDMYLEQHPLRAQYWNSYASLFATLVDIGYLNQAPEEAFVSANKARELAPSRAEPLVTLAHLSFVNGQFNQAIKYAESAVQHAPTYASSLGLLGRLYLETEREAEAIPVLHNALIYRLPDPDHVVALWLLDVYGRNQELRKAADLLEVLLARYPEEDQFYLLIVGAFDGLGEYEQARYWASRLVEKRPGEYLEIEAYIDAS